MKAHIAGFILVVVCCAQALHAATNPPEAAFSPAEIVKQMKVADGFTVTLFAGEPDVRQPIGCCVDDRGRLWVAENYDYVTKGKRERSNRNRILIFEDTDGDGRFDRSKVFLDKLGWVSAVQVGFGGVWIGAAPQFMFVPDRNGDDIPDGEPEILLDGFSNGGWHFLNNFQWGPDGWLYGCHGTSAHSHVGKPGTPLPRKNERVAGREFIRAAIWRFHPTARRFEVFAHGFSNPWGIDWDEHGQMFMTCCIIPPLWHVVQGGRFEDQSGLMYNEFTYDWIKTIYWKPAKGAATPPGFRHRPGGAPGGAVIYLGDSFPDEFRGKLISCSVHNHCVLVDRLERMGSGFRGYYEKIIVDVPDANCMPFHVTLAPDGGLYILDWNSQWSFNCHGGAPGDKDTGRIYKLQHQSAPKLQVNLTPKSDLELVQLQAHKNEWFARHARRMLQERAAQRAIDADAVKALRYRFASETETPARLRALWALHAIKAFNAAEYQRLLEHPSEHVRAWAIQFLCEDMNPPAAALERFEDLAANDPTPIVRLYLASALQRMPAASALRIGTRLAGRAEDATDHNLPLMIWYGVEPHIGADVARGIEFVRKAALPLLQEYAGRRVAQAQDTLPQLIAGIAELDVDRQTAVLRGVAAALEGRRNLTPPPSWPALKEKLAATHRADVKTLLTTIGSRFGDNLSMQTLLEVARDPKETPDARMAAIDQLAAARDPGLEKALSELLKAAPIRRAAIRAGASYDSLAFSKNLVGNFGSLAAEERSEAVAALASRRSYAPVLTEALNKGVIKVSDLNASAVRTLAAHEHPDLNAWIAKNWGTVQATDAEKQKEIARYTELVNAAKAGEAVASRGQEIYKRTCAACHTLFDEGGTIGPDLTGSARRELKYLLENIIDPSASVNKEYQTTILRTKDGRVLTGIVRNETETAVTLVSATESTVVSKSEIQKRVLQQSSIMPEGQLNNLSRQEILDLFAYLRAENP